MVARQATLSAVLIVAVYLRPSHVQAHNQDDEGEFKAQFEPAEEKLGLLVDFHKKGMFPPSVYHSEGHQDGMGLCLYLAIMRRVLGNRFSVAVLDDVVMSVDSQERVPQQNA